MKTALENPKGPLRGLLMVAVWASLCSAITTAVLIYGPNPEPAEGLLNEAQLSSNWLALYKPWILFFHPQFAFIASIGAAFVIWKKRPALALIGIFYLMIWAVTEMTQQAFIIDTLNQFWRPGLLNAEDGSQRQAFETLLIGFPAISDSQYFVLLFGFGVGSVLLGFGLLSFDFLGQIIGVVMVALGVVSLTAFAGYYLAPAAGLTAITGWIYGYLYGPFQTGVRIALAWWLWRQASSE
ncbi:hypothetical protein ACI5KX_03100 [Erythrobacter sp. GH1-10]|uniref:hypothetical protein n=1 Tax=Erythrobacter sp. GH1-10 TaxID=3349334 RepID=UPI003877DD7A